MEEIERRIGAHRFRVWFRNTTHIQLQNNHVKIGVPNMFVGNWIESHFAEQIQQSVRTVTGQDAKLLFSIDPKLFGAQRKGQLDSQAEFIARAADPKRRLRSIQQQAYPARTLRFELDSFVVGPGNQLAYTAAVGVISNPTARYNPLFIHGACGLGKTHLLQGICNSMSRKYKNVKWCYASGEEFTNQFLLALKSSKLDAFRYRYRQLDLLVIDDVHFLASKRATQEEFLHTFNAIDAAGKQVVMASDAHPKMIGQLSHQLVNRFVSGMVVRIDPPDFDTRCRILRRRAKQLSMHLPDDVVEYIAQHLRSNVRELEGALVKVLAVASLTKRNIDLKLARSALQDTIMRTDPIVQASDIENVVATFFGMTPADIHSSKKTHTISLARSIAMYLARKHTTMSYPEIGRFMGNKNHATVILACRRVEKALADDIELCWHCVAGQRRMRIRQLLEQLEEHFIH